MQGVVQICSLLGTGQVNGTHVGTLRKGCLRPSSHHESGAWHTVLRDLSRTSSLSCVYSSHIVHMYTLNKISKLLLLVLITSYCVDLSTVVTPTWCLSTWLAWSYDYVSLSGCVMLAAWHVTGRLALPGRLACPTPLLYIQVQYPNAVLEGAM